MSIARKIGSWRRITRYGEYYGNVTICTFLGSYAGAVQDKFSVILLLFANLLSAGFIFIFNDIEDSEDDSSDPIKRFRNPISSFDITRGAALIFAAAVGVISLSIYFYLGTIVFAIGLSGIVLGFLYSYKKIRLKSKPVVDLITHGLMIGVNFFLTAILLSEGNYSFAVIFFIAIIIFTLSIIGDLKNEIRDYEVDRKTGVNNTISKLNMTGWTQYLSITGLLLNGVLIIYLFYTTSLITKLLLAMIVVLAVIHYSTVRKKYSLLNYPNRQEFYLLLGLVLFLTG